MLSFGICVLGAVCDMASWIGATNYLTNQSLYSSAIRTYTSIVLSISKLEQHSFER